MGMYDSVRVHFPLPLHESQQDLQHVEYQTKDLDCTMDHFIVGTDGRLWREYSEQVLLQLQPEAPFSQDPIPCGMELVDYTGSMDIFGGSHRRENYVEFELTFARGHLECVRLIRSGIAPKYCTNGQRQEQEQRLLEAFLNGDINAE
jgi:hypothetical protein